MLHNKMFKLGVTSLAGLALAACGNEGNQAVDSIRVGYFPNLTHISTIIGLQNGYFQEELPDEIEIETMTFPNGSSFMEALSVDEFDLGTVGPTPATTTYTRNPNHEIIAGAVNGGALLVTGEGSGIGAVEDLDGQSVAIPTIGSTQDIMLRYELDQVGLGIEDEGGTVSLVPQAPADTAALLLQGDVDAAATQEPWAVNMENQANANILLDEEEFAWGTDSTTTVVVAQNEFTANHPELTEAYLRAHARAVEFIEENPEESTEIFVSHINDITGNELDIEETLVAMERLNPTVEINEGVLQEMANISEEAGYISDADIDGLVNTEFIENVIQ